MKNVLITVSMLTISSASVVAQASSSFSMLDADGDGVISLSESKALPKLMSQFKDLDTNGDGALSVEEFAEFKAK
jgi:Ca2+-binding EF-hand superfamily protein